MKADYLIRGLPGHPLHPPLTDAVIGTYTLATIAAFLDVLGISDHDAAKAWYARIKSRPSFRRSSPGSC